MTCYCGRRYDTLEPVKVNVLDRKISSIEYLADTSVDDELPIIAPGLFDIQVNGAVGVELSSSKLTVDGVVAVLQKMLRDGVFRCCLTLTTNDQKVMLHAAKTIADALDAYPMYRPVVWGIYSWTFYNYPESDF